LVQTYRVIDTLNQHSLHLLKINNLFLNINVEFIN